MQNGHKKIQKQAERNKLVETQKQLTVNREMQKDPSQFGSCVRLDHIYRHVSKGLIYSISKSVHVSLRGIAIVLGSSFQADRSASS